MLTKEEKAILSKAYEILDEIYDECDCESDFVTPSGDAKDGIDTILEDAEVEGGEPSGAVHIVVMM
jgi:hypothetical protein